MSILHIQPFNTLFSAFYGNQWKCFMVVGLIKLYQRPPDDSENKSITYDDRENDP